MIIKRSSALPLLAAAFLFASQVATTIIRAEEIVVSGNGSGSSNEVTVSNNSTTAVIQSNSAAITNNVDSSTNTGGNTASGNSGGGVGITTGDATSDLTIQNSLNSSSVEISCCLQDSSVQISGNGATSTNSVDLGITSQTNISISQNARVENNVNASANTGENKAKDNTGGSVLVGTGDIIAGGGIINGGINIYSIKGGSGGGSFNASITSNGAGSTNIITALLGSLAALNVNNWADIRNSVVWDLNTGRNEANGNTGGDVSIRTGDIFFGLLIKNDPVNVGVIDWGCCGLPGDDGDGGPPPGSGGDGEHPPSHDGASSSSGPSGAGAGAEAAAGGFVLALAETSGEAYPVILIGLAMIAAGASLVKKEKFL